MGIINAENTLKFRSTKELFNRIKGFLSSYDSQNMIDEADFYDYVVFVLEKLGVAVYRECEALLKVVDKKAKLPCNYKIWYAAYKCHPGIGEVPSINEQRPWIYYQDNEISQVCPPTSGNCKIGCEGEAGQTKIVVRTYVNGDNFQNTFNNPIPLFLSPNVRHHHHDEAPRMHTKMNEVTIDDEHYIHTNFTNDHIYMQYYGLPFDENFLPMIPDETALESAIEYWIYTKLFEKWYLNDTVPNIGQKLQYVKNEYDRTYFPAALYYVKLPSFQRCIQSIKLLRSKNKFYQFTFDKTRVGFGGYGSLGGRGGFGRNY